MPFLKPKEVMKMQLASETISLCTGNQSFSEVISAGKFPNAYEILTYKETFN